MIMNLLLYVISIYFLFFGTLMLNDILFVSSSANAESLILNYSKNKNLSYEETIYLKIATKIVKYIKLEEYKKEDVRQALAYMKIDLTPEMYYANNIVKMFVIIFISGIPIMFFFPPLIPLPFYLSYRIYKNTNRRIKEYINIKKNVIENGLLHFTYGIIQELHGNANIVNFIERYQKSSICDQTMKLELQLVIADSNNYNDLRIALYKFMNRIRSNKLSEVIRATISILDGQMNINRFEDIAERLAEEQKNEQLKTADTLPNKILGFNSIVFMATLLFLLAMMGMLISTSLEGIF